MYSMKIFIAIACAGAVLFASRAELSTREEPQQQEPIYGSNLGDIRLSILAEKEFQRVHGPEWQLLKRQATSEDLKRLMMDPEASTEANLRPKKAYSAIFEKLPDAGGRVLRGKNNDPGKDYAKNKGNPDGDLPLGTPQGDMFRRHNHQLRFRAWQSTSDSGDGINGIGLDNSIACNHGNGSDGIEILAAGGNETRSRSITVNIFIKTRLKTANRSYNVERSRIHEDYIKNVEAAAGYVNATNRDDVQRLIKKLVDEAVAKRLRKED